MKAFAAKAILIAFVIAMFYLMLVADSVVARFFALAVYSLVLTLVVAGWAALEAKKQGVAEGMKAALNLKESSR